MNSKQDKKMARLMTAWVIEFRGWRKNITWRRRRWARRLLYESILHDMRQMPAVLDAMFPGPSIIMDRWFKNVG